MPDPAPAADLLRRAGEALYGERWQSPLARDLGVAVRTMQRWAAGEQPTPAGIWPEIGGLLGDRAIEIAALRQLLTDAADAAA